MADNEKDDIEFEDQEEYQFENDDNLSFDEDEFNFEDEDAELLADNEAMPAKKRNFIQSFVDKIKEEGIGKNGVSLLIGLFVIGILLFAVYQLFSVLFSSSPVTNTVTKTTTTTAGLDNNLNSKGASEITPSSSRELTLQPPDNNSIANNDISNTLPVPSSSAPVSSTDSNIEAQSEQIVLLQQKVLELSQRIDNLEKNNSSIVQSLTLLQQQSNTALARIETLAQGINNIQAQSTKLNNALTAILETAAEQPTTTPSSTPAPVSSLPSMPAVLQNQEQETRSSMYNEVEPAVTPTKKVAQGEPLREETMASTVQSMISAYYVQAIIPGRAWLKDQNGKVFTIALGDQVPGYGKIVEINPEDGFVLTENGTKIEYGIDQY